MTSTFLFPLLLLISNLIRAAAVGGSGSWDLLLHNAGVSAMHMQLLHTDRVVFYDRTDFGPSNIALPAGKCRHDANDITLKNDCTAHSVEYDVTSNTVRPLTVLTDVWCSSAAVMPDGTLVQAGGFNDGDRAVRIYTPCRDTSCDWKELNAVLRQRRWYATSQILPDGRQIIVGGRRQFNYEFYPKSTAAGVYNLPFLVETMDPTIENNLYPFVFLNTDGNLFIFANNRAVLFDYSKAAVVRTYPAIPGGDPRSYPSTGSAVLLPLKENAGAQVLVCGGAPKGSFVKAINGEFVRALNTCGRIRINDLNPEWLMESMPMGRTMSDMILLPNGQVLIINGAGSGSAGWELGRDPILNPVIYRPDNPVGSRFEKQDPSSRSRMYHSTAVLLRDGRVLVGGSNPHAFYNYTGVLFPTDLTLEAFSPAYLDPSYANLRPRIVSPNSQSVMPRGQRFAVRFTFPPAAALASDDGMMVTMVAPSFTTHSFAMNQRLLVLTRGVFRAVGGSTYEIETVAPGSANLAPSGFYLLFVVHRDVPSEAIWVRIK